MDGAASGLVNLLPAIIFLVGCFLAFATGTSWGTFGILIPIVVICTALTLYAKPSLKLSLTLFLICHAPYYEQRPHHQHNADRVYGGLA